MRHRTSNSPADTAGNNDDNIRVAYTRATDSGDDDKSSFTESKKLELAQPEADNYEDKGKAPAQLPEQDVDMMDIDHDETDLDDDNVTEYSFKSEDYPHDSELEDLDDDDARSHISLSDDEPEVPSVIGPVDWKELTRDQRVEYERMFGSVHLQPLNGSWTFTENYHRHIDEQCLTYLDAFKPEEWVLPRHDTEYILNKLLERIRIRKKHAKVYGPPVHSSGSRSHQLSHRHSQAPLPPPGHHMSGNQMLRSQPSAQPMGEPPGARLGQPLRQPMAFVQSPQYQNGGLPAGGHPGQPIQGPPYSMPGQMPPQPIPPLRSNMGPPAKPPRKLKINVADRGHREQALQVPLPLKAPTPPYPLRERPDQRKTVGKAGRGKTRRQAEADEFPWNRHFDFKAAKEALQSKDSWDLSVYDQAMLDEMERTRVRNKPVVEVLEDEITAKQKVARKKKNPPAKAEVSSEEEGEGEADAEHEDQNVARRTKGGRKKSRSAGETGGDPYHSGNFAFASPEDQQLASTMGMRTVDELIDAGMIDKISLDELFRIKICWSPGKKGNSQDLEQAKFSVKDTVTTRKMLDKTRILSHRAGECIIDFCPDLLWRDILLRILSEAGFSNKDIRDRFCLNGSFSDRATVAKRLSAALGKDTNPPRGEGKKAALDWCETNRDDFDNYQAFFGKRPPARRTAQGRKNSKLLHGKTVESDENSSPFKSEDKGEGSKKLSRMALDGAADEELSAAEESDGEDQEDAVSLQDSDELDAMSD